MDLTYEIFYVTFGTFYNTVGTLGILSMLLSVTLFPLYFNIKITPEIERKLNLKLGYYKISYIMLPYIKVVGRYFEIAAYITVKFILYKLGKNADEINFCPRTYALQRARYSVKLFTLKEIVWSILAVINALIFIISVIILQFIHN